MPRNAPRSPEALAAAARRRRHLENALPWLVIGGMFLIWEAGVRLFNIQPFILPAPSAIAASSLLLGVVIGSSVLVYRGLYPLLIAFNSVPKVAVVPVLVIWFGAGFWPAVLTAFLISFFPIVVNVATGIATVEPELRDVLRALGASQTDIIRKVGLPRAMPYFFASLKVAITVAFVGSIISETVAANEGIGHLMLVASSRFDVPLVFAGLIITGVMGVAMYWVAVTIEERTTGWATRGQQDPRLATGG